MLIQIEIPEGITAKGIPDFLRLRANKLDGVVGREASKLKSSELNEDEKKAVKEIETADEPKLASKKAAPKNRASFEDDEEIGAAPNFTDNDHDDFKTPEPIEKKTKAKKLTVDDVNDACKARAARTGGKEGRTEVLTILKKKFKTTSVSELKPEQYADAIAAMEA